MLDIYLRNKFTLPNSHYPMPEHILQISNFTLIGKKTVDYVNYKIYYRGSLLISTFISKDNLYMRIIS